MSHTRVSINEDSWDFDDRKLDLKDAFAIKAASGLGVKGFLVGVEEMEPLAMQALVWFLRHKKEPGLRMEDVNFIIADLNMESVDDPADPTPATSESEKTT